MLRKSQTHINNNEKDAKMNRSIVGGVATTMLALVAVFGGAASAQADDCTSTHACVWQNSDYNTGWYLGNGFRAMTQSDQYYTLTTWSDVAGNLNDAVSSVKSYGGSCRLRFFTDEKYAGSSIYFNRVADGSNYEDPLLSNGGGTGTASGQNWDDRISSHQFVDCV
jgi:hypothetical protein